ncbi:ankyrin [Staphylotrichum tortipilum]|uniref:Ankyrin n=1 Tax=Staphylotrichum tortipilum TaxID=2831512 RepID=A0AAN6MG41_9PEZI|nr:ankyrin [Staphylotrichum longicolle]
MYTSNDLLDEGLMFLSIQYVKNTVLPDDVFEPGQTKPRPVKKSLNKPAERGTPRAALVGALFNEDVERCRQLLDAHPELVNIPLQHQAHGRVPEDDSAWCFTYREAYQGVTPVVFASLVPRFREPHLDSRALSPSGLAIMELLVERGAALEGRPGADGWTPYLLTEICRDYDSPEALSLLASIGADIHTTQLDDYQRPLLQVAAGRGAIGAIGFLLDRGVPMNYTSGYDGCHINGTPLHSAAANGRHQAVKLLLSREALSDMEKMDWESCTPLLCAARGSFSPDDYISPLRDLDQEETIRLLVNAGADLAVSDRRDLRWSPGCGGRDPFPDSPLGHLSSWGGAGIIRYLAGKGCDIYQRRSYPKDGSFPIGVGGDKPSWILGADPDATDEYGRQPLHWAAIGRCLELSPKSRRISYTWSGLRAESQSSTLSVRLAALESAISHLVAYNNNASIGRQDAFGRTPLHYAASLKLVGAVVLLVEKGADPGLPDNEGRTALHHLVDPLFDHDYRIRDPIDGDLEDEPLGAALAAQLNGGGGAADMINHADNTGRAALHVAARAASDTAVALLLSLGADPNLHDGDGSTSLHLAARPADWLLLGAGADATVRDAQGRTAAEIENAVSQKLRQGREEYLEDLARPRPEFGRGRGRGRGFGRGWPTAPAPAPAPAPASREDGGVDVSAGAGHGRGG